MLKVYLAGPDVFLPDAVAIGIQKKRLCAAYGFQGLYPFDNEISAEPNATGVDNLIYHANMAMIQEADFGITNLTPFRGPSADVGTVFELGVLVALSKPVYGYTNELDDLFTRLQRRTRLSFDRSMNIWRDEDAMTVENFGNADNLMITAALAAQGHPIIRHAANATDPLRDLTGFECCLRLAANDLLHKASPEADISLR